MLPANRMNPFSDLPERYWLLVGHLNFGDRDEQGRISFKDPAKTFKWNTTQIEHALKFTLEEFAEADRPEWLKNEKQKEVPAVAVR